MARTFRRPKSYRWTAPPLVTSFELPDAKLLVDSDADFLLCAWSMWISSAMNSVFYRISDAAGRYISSADCDLSNDITTSANGASAPEQGYGNIVKVINPYRRIPAGAALTIRLVEWSGVNPQQSWVKIVFHGFKEYVL